MLQWRLGTKPLLFPFISIEPKGIIPSCLTPTGQKHEDAAFLHNLSNQGPTNQEMSVESKTAEVFKKDMHVQKDQQHKTSDITSF